MSEAPLKAQFFVTRENDTMVPLVALDELPDHIIIKDVPRIIRPSNIQGMHCVGVFESRHKKHVVTNLNQSPFTPLNTEGLYASLGGGNNTQTPAFAITAPHTVFPPPYNPFRIEQTYPGTKTNNPAEAQQLAQPQTVESATSSRKPSLCSTQSLTSPVLTPTPESKEGSTHGANSGSKAAPGVKEFCSYWLRKGECDYAQQGCLYKHEMPLDKDTLNRLGLRDIPQWYRELHGVGSFLAVHGAGASFSGPGLKSIVSTDSTPRLGRTARDWRGDSSTEESSAARNRHRRTGLRHNTAPVAADNRGTTQPASKRGAMINNRPRRELILKKSSPLAGQPKLRSHETVADRQNLETIRALDAHKKHEASKSAVDNGLLRSKFAATVVDNDNKLVAKVADTVKPSGLTRGSSDRKTTEATTSELDVSGNSTRGSDVSSPNDGGDDDDDDGQGNASDEELKDAQHQGIVIARPPQYLRQRHRRHHHRAPSNTSTMLTDVEAEIFRSDAERRAREDAAYATVQAEQERNHAVRLAKLKLDKLKLEDSTRGLMEKIDSLKDDLKMSTISTATNLLVESSRAGSVESGSGRGQVGAGAGIVADAVVGGAGGVRRASNGKARSGGRGRQGSKTGSGNGSGNGNGNGKGKGPAGKGQVQS